MKIRLWFAIIAFVGGLFLLGCGSGINRSGVIERYDQTILKFSNSADVLAGINQGENELLSQSESVVTVWGKAKKGASLWFNAVAFDEDLLTAVRKYCFTVNEKAKRFLLTPSEQKLKFQAHLVLPQEVLDEPYANENVKRIAILKNIQTSFNDDMIQVTPDSQTLESAVLMVNQALNTVLKYDLEQSAGLAAKLSTPKGLKFLHISMGKSSIQLFLEDDIASVTIKLGNSWFSRAAKP